ncbi:Phenylacetate 2-hydroxylase [Lachnellula subtilissima]|uniref:Phenylacetate 2-hydroxylase n=1 Tax=Lachnellula subtilissima TaxID=602034 RepID=A0A8H8UHZ2_9HELO|nr:Phenylacetate 2-hydroxylase [Lachnellula subtilissima]
MNITPQKNFTANVGDTSSPAAFLASSPAIVVLIATVILLCIFYKQATWTDVSKVASIPEAPDGLPFIGHLLSLGGREKENDSTIYSRWASRVSSDLFQMRLGSQRAIVVSSFAAIKDIWIGHSSKLIDRPYQHGFADKLGLDVSGAAMTEPIRRCRKAAMRALGKPQWPGYYKLLELNSLSLVRNAVTKGENGRKAIDIYPFSRQVVFDLVLSLTYGARQKDADDETVLSLINAINDISSIRSSTQRYRDYVPLLRVFPERTSTVIAAEKIRQKHLDTLYASLNARIARGEEVPCVASMMNDDRLTQDEIHGTCKSLLQAAPDSTASGAYMCIAWLCSPDGAGFQEEALAAILQEYKGDRDQAWKMAFREERVSLIVSLYKEALRFFTTTPFATPRTTVKEFEYRGTKIPKGITMVMNAQAANHDTEWYGESASRFVPTRFMNNDTPLPHLTFGAGSRICPAVAISNRIIYALLTRLILAFEMKESDDPSARKPNIDVLDFSDVHTSLVAIPRPFDCSFVPRDLEWLGSKLEVEEEEIL